MKIAIINSSLLVYASRIPIIIIDSESLDCDLHSMRIKTDFLSMVVRNPFMLDGELQLEDLQDINMLETRVEQFFEFIKREEFRGHPEDIQNELKKSCVET